MKNVEKFPKGCRKVRPPALHPLCITAPVAIYIHCDEYIDSPWKAYMSTMSDIHLRQINNFFLRI